MVSKTRDRLIEVARQLFARKGVENTTMLDIAAASDRGRRTLYTYFRNKREIHQAVIEREGEQAVARERAVQLSDLTAREKLRSILFARFETLRCEAAQRSADPRPLMSLLEGKRVGKSAVLPPSRRWRYFATWWRKVWPPASSAPTWPRGWCRSWC